MSIQKADANTLIGPSTIDSLASDIVRYTRGLPGNQGHEFAVACLIGAYYEGVSEGMKITKSTLLENAK